jgi:hypothetical protein
VRRLAASVAGVVAACSGTALAHGGQTTGPHDALPAVGVFLAGAAVLGVSVFFDARAAVDRRYADVGVFAGLGAIIASVLLYAV